MKSTEAQGQSMIDWPDYATLKKLAAALWHQESAYQGAAVMIGSGFSRSAASTGDGRNRLPLWGDLAKILADELDTDSHSDPLRLADEYCAYFGKQALHDLLKKEINDAAWAPGELHKTLLELPWSEVLTTNWDTLLERASLEVHQPVYSLVYRQDALSSARSPRIVKLHGTIDITENLIFTQEDYRKYPHSHAALVNFARQVFIENELCLLGFSGNDPNFLQWTGWVRDHLATHARRIYLVGALNLSIPQRKYLESINVAPIDLGSVVGDYEGDAKHSAATRLFLHALRSLKPKQPWEWSPTQLMQRTFTAEEHDKRFKDHVYAASLLERQVATLEADRNSYPGWLVCPSEERRQLQTQISDPYPNLKNISAMEPGSRARLLYEIAWRHSITYEAVPPWLAQELLTICRPNKPNPLTKQQQMEVALLLLKNTRWFDDPEMRSIEGTVTAILESGTKHWPDSANELAFHRAVVARDQFDYPSLEKLASQIEERNPIWKLKKASLQAELCQYRESDRLIAEAHRELLSLHRSDRNSLYVFSRLAWAHWFLRGIETLKLGKPFQPFPPIYQESKCSPWDHIEFLRSQILSAREKQQKQQDIEPSFEPGSYTDSSSTVTFSSGLHPILLLDGLANSTGMPLRSSYVSFLVEPASRLAELDQVDDVHRFALAIRAASSEDSDALKHVFSRTRIASLPKCAATLLHAQSLRAVEYWSSKLSGGSDEVRRHAIERLRVFIEVLARVSVRVHPEQAKRVFRLACSLGKKPECHHYWLFPALRHLIDYALESIPQLQHHELTLEALSFPLQTEIGVSDGPREWPNPVIDLPGTRSEDLALDRRLDEIIEKVAPCSTQSAQALSRLIPLFENGFLNDIECQKISKKIWGEDGDYQKLPETGLLSSVLLELPSENVAAVKDLVRRHLFQVGDSELFDASRLTDIARAGQLKKAREIPSEDEAKRYFDRMVAWRAMHRDNDLLGFAEREEKRIGELIGTALAHSIVPALPSTALTENAFNKLYVFYTEVYSPEVVRAFPHFAVQDLRFSDDVETVIRQALRKKDANCAAHASYALLIWRELNNSPATERLITALISQIASNRMPGLAGLLWTANQMYDKGYLSASDTDSLVEIVPALFDADYGSIPVKSREAVSTSLVRAACVRLARDILKINERKSDGLLRVLEEAREDALPEVRFAEFQDP